MKLLPIEKWKYCNDCENEGQYYVFPFRGEEDKRKCECRNNPISVYYQTRLAIKLAKILLNFEDWIKELRIELKTDLTKDIQYKLALEDINIKLHELKSPIGIYDLSSLLDKAEIITLEENE